MIRDYNNTNQQNASKQKQLRTQTKTVFVDGLPLLPRRLHTAYP